MEAQQPELTRRFGRGVALGVLCGGAIAGIGFLMLHYGFENLGAAMFMALPFLTGAVIGLVSSGIDSAAAAAVITLFMSLAILIGTGLEGIVCCLMALPIIAGAMTIGVVSGLLVKRWTREGDERDVPRSLLAFAAAPVILLGTDVADRSRRDAPQHVIVTTTHRLDVPPETAWSLLEEVERLDAPKPFLLKIGLPVPTHCVLTGRDIGAQRVCYFEQGRLEEAITRWEPPRRFDMKITRSTLPGRTWLGFISASYEFEPAGSGGTIVRRTSTISSELAPRWYWEPLERVGVESLHEYLFDSIAARH